MSYTIYYYFDKKGNPKKDVLMDGNKFTNSEGQPINIKRCTDEEYLELLRKKAVTVQQQKLF